MRALTVQQPWAWAVVHAGKLTENRSVPWAYRGELAIHAGTRWSDRGGEDPRVTAAAWEAGGDFRPTAQLHGPDFLLPGPERPVGCIIGLSDMVDAHWAEDGCCEDPWAEWSYAEHGGKVRRDVAHLVLENMRPLREPVYVTGRLGLWKPPADVQAEVYRQAA